MGRNAAEGAGSTELQDGAVGGAVECFAQGAVSVALFDALCGDPERLRLRANEARLSRMGWNGKNQGQHGAGGDWLGRAFLGRAHNDLRLNLPR